MPFPEIITHCFFSDVKSSSEASRSTPSTHKSVDPEHHMDVHSLDGAVQHYFSAVLTQSTHKTYQATANKYFAFCESFNLKTLPTSEAILCYFTACLGQQGLAQSTIRTYISGIRKLQIAHGLPEPKVDTMP